MSDLFCAIFTNLPFYFVPLSLRQCRMEVVRKSLDSCHKFVRPASRKLSGSCQEVVRQLSQSCQTAITKLSGLHHKSHQAVARKIPNICQAIIWLSSSSCLFRLLPGSCQKVVRKFSRRNQTVCLKVVRPSSQKLSGSCQEVVRQLSQIC